MWYSKRIQNKIPELRWQFNLNTICYRLRFTVWPDIQGGKQQKAITAIAKIAKN